MHLCELKNISEAVETGYFDVAARMLRNLIQEIEETNEKREWVGLTDEEAKKTFQEHNCVISADLAGILARAVEAKLKEKNT